MAAIAYVNGRFRRLADPSVPIEDRGNQLADGAYEVIKAMGVVLVDRERHLDRLERSLGELRIAMPTTRAALVAIVDEVVRRARLREAVVYLHVSRGAAPRNHPFPKGARPTLIVTARAPHWPSAAEREEGVAVISLPDERWARCDIKSIALLPNVLAKQRAVEAGCREAWLVRDGVVTEGSTSNAYIVDRDGRLVTHPRNERILAGVTRSVVLELAAEEGVPVEERPFTLEEAHAAREAGLTSTTSWLLPVTRIDGRPVGNGRPGLVIGRLMERYALRLDALAGRR
jgi:D-alanine transaminase